jgi:hypothetical protein
MASGSQLCAHDAKRVHEKRQLPAPAASRSLCPQPVAGQTGSHGTRDRSAGATQNRTEGRAERS